MPSCDNFSYMALNLMGEVGEFMGKVAKHIRKGEAFIDDGVLYFKRNMPAEVVEALSGMLEMLKISGIMPND